jgi:hypothetical protein
MNLLAVQRDFGAFLRGGDAAAAAPGMRVYQNNYRAQLFACLVDSFALTRDWIGAETFESAVIHHIHRVPPGSWTLDAYPRDFPDTLAMLHPDDPEIAELAWLELALAEAFVGPATAPLLPADARNIDWDDAVLSFTPTLDMRPAASNACEIWSALAAGEKPPSVSSLSAGRVLIVWRFQLISRFRLIDAEEEQAIMLARSGLRFADLCAAFVATCGEEEGIALAGSHLGRWLADGLLDSATGDSKCV